MSEIQEIYNEYLNMLKRRPEDVPNVRLVKTPQGYNYEDEHSNALSPTMGLFKLILERRGFMASPKVISKKDYKNYLVPEIYHGFKEKEHGMAFLNMDNYHLGTGTQMGTYFSREKEEAISYTGEKGVSEKGKVLPAKLTPARYENLTDILQILNVVNGQSSVISIDNPEYKQKINELMDFCADRDEDNEKFKFFIYMTKTAQMMAVYLGLDYLSMQKGSKEHIVLFNRSKLVVSEEMVREFSEECEEK